jgi:hypothetical protein
MENINISMRPDLQIDGTDIKLIYNIRNILNFIPQTSNIVVKNTNIFIKDITMSGSWVHHNVAR